MTAARPTPSPDPVDVGAVVGDWAGRLGGALMFAAAVLALVAVTVWIVRHLNPEGYWVYEIDTDDGTLLYIGSTGDLEKRMRGHESYQRRLPDGHPRKWWPDAAAEVQANHWPTRHTWYRSKAIAQEIEKQRIRQKNPVANGIRYKGVPSAGE